MEFSIEVTNYAPVANNDDQYTMLHDRKLDVSASAGVLDNDTDQDGDALTASLVNGPSHGSLTFNGNGSFVYTPTAGYVGSDTFTYKVNDGAADSSIATVTIDVTNVAPVANDDDQYTMLHDRALDVSASAGVLGNDTDQDGDTLRASLVNDPSHGSLTFNGNGSFVYTPTAGYVGSDTFTYKVNDGAADSSIATVTIDVTNVAPTVSGGSYDISHSGTLVEDAPGVLAGANDGDGDQLTARVVTDPAHGVVFINTDGSFIYVPDRSYVGPDSFSFKANDGAADSDAATININVTNVAPTVSGGSYDIGHNDTLVEDAPGVLAGANDGDRDQLTASVVTDPAHGVVFINTDGSFIYVPDRSYVGPDAFSFKANDGVADSDAATININVTNVAPTVSGGSYDIGHNGTLVEDAPGVLAGANDGDGDQLTARVVTDPAHGVVFINTDGSFIYVPDRDYVGPDSFSFKANDGDADSDAATININVTNADPVAVNDYATGTFNTELNIDVLSNDTDPDGDVLTVQSTDNGNVRINNDGTLTYTPNTGFVGTDSFRYTISDGHGGTATATVFINVPNQPPVAVNDSADARPGTPVTIDVLGNDSDPEGQSLTIDSVGQACHGSVSINEDGTLTYTSVPGYTGTDSFSYTINDGNGGTATATVTISVHNATPTAGNQSGVTSVETPVDFNLLAAAADDDGDLLSVVGCGSPANGTVSVDPSGVATYTPNAGFVGDDEFTYTITDPYGAIATGTIYVSVLES